MTDTVWLLVPTVTEGVMMAALFESEATASQARDDLPNGGTMAEVPVNQDAGHIIAFEMHVINAGSMQ